MNGGGKGRKLARERDRCAGGKDDGGIGREIGIGERFGRR